MYVNFIWGMRYTDLHTLQIKIFPASGSGANFLSSIIGNTTNKILRSISTVEVLGVSCCLAFIKLGEIIAGYPPLHSYDRLNQSNDSYRDCLLLGLSDLL